MDIYCNSLALHYIHTYIHIDFHLLQYTYILKDTQYNSCALTNVSCVM